MKFKALHSTLALTFLGCLAAHPAHADVTYDFFGTVTFDSSGDLPIGTTYTVALDVDSTENNPNAALATYNVIGGTITYSTGYSATLSTGEVSIDYNMNGKDGLHVSTTGDLSPTIYGRYTDQLSFNLVDPTDTALSSRALPASINTADWNVTQATFLLGPSQLGELNVLATLNSSPQAVPDGGSTMPILGLAMGGLAWLRRRCQ